MSILLEIYGLIKKADLMNDVTKFSCTSVLVLIMYSINAYDV